MRDPLPEPKIRRAINITGSIAGVFFRNGPTANNDDPTRQSPENKKAPTENTRSYINNLDTLLPDEIMGSLLF